MDTHEKLSALIDLAREAGITVRRGAGFGTGEHPGGACVRLQGREVLFLDTAAPVIEQVRLLAATLQGRPGVEDRFILPELREEIDRASPD